MTTPPDKHRATAQPPWIVQAVFDPDGEGSDFAYTIGLADLGHPELHIWARPSLGEDPGLDWKFTPRDLCGILNLLGGLLVDGELGVGSTLRRSVDCGLATVELRVDPPGDREELEAYGVADGAEVLPVKWSLSRPPLGPARPVEESVAAAARRRYDDLRARLTEPVSLPRGWTLPEEPSFDLDQRLGPFTPLALARAAHLGQADSATLADFLDVAGSLDEMAALSAPIVRARALGRPVGRVAAFEELHVFVDRLCDHWIQEFATRQRWKAVVEEYYTPRRPGTGTRAEVDRRLRTLLHSAVESCLAGEVAFDVADEELRLSSAGPWETAATRGEWPGPGWYASEEVLLAVQELLDMLTPEEMWGIAAAHRAALTGRAPGSGSTAGGYAELALRLDTLSIVSKAVLPPVEALVGRPGDPAGSVPLDQLPGLLGDTLADWLQYVTTILVRRSDLPTADVATFVRPLEDIVPWLGDFLGVET